MEGEAGLGAAEGLPGQGEVVQVLQGVAGASMHQEDPLHLLLPGPGGQEVQLPGGKPLPLPGQDLHHRPFPGQAVQGQKPGVVVAQDALRPHLQKPVQDPVPVGVVAHGVPQEEHPVKGRGPLQDGLQGGPVPVDVREDQVAHGA